MTIPREKFCARDIEIPQNVNQNIRPYGVSRMSMNAKRDAIAIASSNLWRSDANTFLSKMLNEAA